MGEKYRPSNSSEGEWFENKFCNQCEENRAWMEHECDPCPIQGAVMALSIDDENYPNQWVRRRGGPECTAFRPMGSGTAEQAKRDREKYEAALAEMRASP